MSQVPLFKSGSIPLDMWQTKLKSALDPVLKNTILQGRQLTGLTLGQGTNVYNHGLGREQQGFFHTDISGPAIFWRSAPFNSTTLTIQGSTTAAVTLSLWVY